MRYIFDVEGNGLREDITKVWCLVMKDINTEDIYFYTPDTLDEGFKHLMEAKLLIGHNIISYDFPVLNRLYGLEYKGEVYDTLVVSRLLNPDRSGGHSLDSWGRRLGRSKPTHEEWDRFSEEMLHRCQEDVEINYLTYLELEKEVKYG